MTKLSIILINIFINRINIIKLNKNICQIRINNIFLISKTIFNFVNYIKIIVYTAIIGIHKIHFKQFYYKK